MIDLDCGTCDEEVRRSFLCMVGHTDSPGMPEGSGGERGSWGRGLILVASTHFCFSMIIDCEKGTVERKAE